MSNENTAPVEYTNGSLSEVGVTEADLVMIRIMARTAGMTPAEHVRNMLCSIGMVVSHVTVDGVTAVTPDFDMELATLLKIEAGEDTL